MEKCCNFVGGTRRIGSRGCVALKTNVMKKKKLIDEKRANVLHGVLLMALFSFSAFYIADFQWVKDLSLSPLIVGIVLGMLYANSLRNYIPDTWVPGIKLCTKQILRTGIIFYGFRLTLQDVMNIGAPAIVIDAIVIAGTILLGLLFGKMLKMDRDTVIMTSTGSAICGAAAVLGAEPVVKCAPHKTAIAVSTVVIFGTISMFLYPALYRMGVFDLDPQCMAIYTGSTLHEVAHVAGAGNAMDPTGAVGIEGPATITKMIRVIMLAPVLIIFAFCIKPSNENGDASHGKRKIAVPWFAFWFIGVILINSLIISSGAFSDAFLSDAHHYIERVDTFMLTMAMTALGAETSLEKFKQAGAKPFALAGLIYLWLLGGGYLLAKYLAPVLA